MVPGLLTRFWPTVLSVEPMVQYVVCLSVVCLSVCLSVCDVLYCGKTVHPSQKVIEWRHIGTVHQLMTSMLSHVMWDCLTVVNVSSQVRGGGATAHQPVAPRPSPTTPAARLHRMRKWRHAMMTSLSSGGVERRQDDGHCQQHGCAQRHGYYDDRL